MAPTRPSRPARRVESVHGNHPEAPDGLADFLDEVAESLDEHMHKEEQILFPMLRNGGHPMIGHPIGMMRERFSKNALKLVCVGQLRLTSIFLPTLYSHRLRWTARRSYGTSRHLSAVRSDRYTRHDYPSAPRRGSASADG
jgi:hypothetical protein